MVLCRPFRRAFLGPTEAGSLRPHMEIRPLSEQPTTHLVRKQVQEKTLSLLLVSLALALRLVYVPIHLAQDEHLGAGGHPLSHASAEGEHADDGHDHRDDHPPHPASDHVSELIAQRAPSQQQISIDLQALPPVESWLLPARCARSTTTAPEPRAPKQWPRLAQRPRGPPAAA